MVRQLMPDSDVRFLTSLCGSGKGAAMVTAVAYRYAAQQAERQAVLNTLRLSREQLLEVKGRLRERMLQGLSKQTHQESSVKMLPTYVISTLNGTGYFKEAVQTGAFKSCFEITPHSAFSLIYQSKVTF